MDGQRAVFERGMLAQRLLLFRAPARSKRYMNMPRGLAQLGRMWERVCVGAGLPAMQAPRCISDTQLMPSQASRLPHVVPRRG
ncbi:hypothetical protein B7453_01385 [Pseudomonas sp. IB20]|nr:hypothetical protein B7453_01385 [Pseudomonas sp. IB20]